jgi:hypothetical protein
VSLVAERRFEEVKIRLVLEEVVRLVDCELDVPVCLLGLLVEFGLNAEIPRWVSERTFSTLQKKGNYRCMI